MALERRQRRSEVRVDVQVPLTLITPDSDRVAGTTCAAFAWRCDGPFRRGRSNSPWVRASSSCFAMVTACCDLTARILGFEGRVGRLAFSPLDLRQENVLVGPGVLASRGLAIVAALATARSAASKRPRDPRAGSAWLVLVIGGPWARQIGTRRARAKRPTRRAAVVGVVRDRSGASIRARIAAQQSATFERDVSTRRDHRFSERHRAARPTSRRRARSLPCRSPRSSRAATLELRYGSLLAPSEATLELWLNGTRVADLPPAGGLDVRADVSLPADLLTTDNTLSFHLTGTCAACGIGPSPWITVSPVTVLRVSGSRLPLVNDLSLLPVLLPRPDWSASRRSCR